MRKILVILAVILFGVLTAQFCNAQTPDKEEDYIIKSDKLLVLPDNIEFSSTNYLVYPDTSVMFASETINELKAAGVVEIVSMTEIRDALRKDVKLSVKTANALKEFKYNYNIPFVDFSSIAHYFSTDKVLIITSQTDIQNYFLRRTLWDFLNIPGATVINPAYKISTYAALIDVDKEVIIWEDTFYKSIASMENRMIAQNFAPATEQLQKLKIYSRTLCPLIASIVQNKIRPPFPLEEAPGNIIDVSTEIIPEALPEADKIELKPKVIVPKRTKLQEYGAIINDL